MEKISGIVRGNARVTTSDNKAAPSRTGMPTFGRPAGESTPTVPKTTSTASRAVALHNGMTEAKKAISQGRVISQMADEFFMSKARPAEVPVEEMLPNPIAAKEGSNTDELVALEEEGPSVETPVKAYTPRGSYVDVRA